MLLVRIAFWIAVVAVLLPTAPDSVSGDGSAQAATGTPAEEAFDAAAAVDMAVSTGSDVISFCERNAAVCNTVSDAGSHVLHQIIYYTGEAMSWATQALIDARQSDVPAPIPSPGASTNPA